MKSQTTLGLDLGPNSIGWALVDDSGKKIIAAGVRVFPEGVDAFDTAKEKSRTQERRTKRGMRRQIARRARRKRKLRELLTSHGLLPNNADESAAIIRKDPYALRARGPDHQLSLFEFGRVLLHLATRRGFLSNSKADKAKADETSKMKIEMSELGKAIDSAGHRTLGEHLASLVAKPGERPNVRIRGKHTRRDMLHKEFDLLWASQRVHYPTYLSDELKKKLNDPSGDETWWMGGAIFGQRNLYWPASMIGKCEFEPKERRAPKAERIAQRYRMVSEINNLKYIDAVGKSRTLDADQRAVLLDHLSKAEKMTFDQVRKKLGFPENIKFNLEAGERSKLKGHIVDCIMARESSFGKTWWELSETRRDEIVHFLADPRNSDEAVKAAATNRWGLSPEQADKLPALNLPAGYMSLSRKALEKLLPHMEKGLLLMTDDDSPCALVAAGYLRPDQRGHRQLASLPEPPDLPNPVVRQTLHELRRVVNAIIREFGKPDRINIELARSIKMGPNDRDKYNKARREREDERSDAADAIRAESPDARLSRDLIDKYLLWKQQAGQCVYSGHSISLKQLLGGEVDVDHILPRWRSLDDSFANKVVCFRDMNREKGDRTPFEWLGGQPERYEAMRQRIAHLPFRKRERFTQEKLDTDEFSSRQLVDTAYITRAAVEYLQCLVERRHYVLGGKGTYTSELRHLWGLETVLSELPNSPAWTAQADLRPGEKNRADHRHHAIDAIVVAFTDRSRLQKLSRLYKTGESGAELEPWPHFRNAVVDSVKSINVSHRVQRKVRGAFHAEMIYGAVRSKLAKGDIVTVRGFFVRRISVRSLTPAMVGNIRDRTIRELIFDRLRERGLEHGRGASSFGIAVWEPPLTMPSGVPIQSVRVKFSMNEDSVVHLGPSRIVAKDKNHHVEIFALPRDERVFRIVSVFEAAGRLRARKPVVDRLHSKGGKFLMSLSINEMVLVEGAPGGNALHRVQKMDVNGGIILRPHSFSGKAKDTDRPPLILRKTGNTLRGRKVTVDPIGRIRWAND